MRRIVLISIISIKVNSGLKQTPDKWENKQNLVEHRNFEEEVKLSTPRERDDSIREKASFQITKSKMNPKEEQYSKEIPLSYLDKVLGYITTYQKNLSLKPTHLRLKQEGR